MAVDHVLILLAGCCFIRFGSADHWAYPDLEKTEVADFPHWGGTCDSGHLQSPIDLTIAGSLKGEYPMLEFHNYEHNLISPSLVNNGHTVKLAKFSSQMTLTGGPLESVYVAEEVHFHWWSEHTINKIRYPLEAHIVHRNKRYRNITEAVKHKDGIAVMGILYHVSNRANTGVSKILEDIEFINAFDEINKPVVVEQKLNLKEFFPNLSDGYLTYQGSLTTPPCAESVTWIVRLDTFPITLQQVDSFKTIETDDGHQVKNNYRDLQRKHNRAVVIVQESSADSGAPARLGPSSLIALSVAAAAVAFHIIL